MFSQEKNKVSEEMIKEAIEIATYGLMAVTYSDLPKLTAESYAKFVAEMEKAGFSRREAIEIVCNTNPMNVSGK